MTREPQKPRLIRPYAMLFIAALIFLWVRSFWHTDSALIVAPFDRLQGIISRRGHLQLMLSTISLGDPWSWSMQVHSDPIAPPIALALDDLNRMLDIAAAEKTLDKFGFELSGKTLLNGSAIVVGVPHALPIALLAILPTRSFIRWRRWNRRGLCKGCGYDLCASTERCPECGRPIDEPAVEPPGEPAASPATADPPE